MKTRALGEQGLVVSAQGLGCMGMSQAYGDLDEATALATLNRALDLGVTFWDTANVYGDAGPGGFGSNELLLSQVLADRRDEVTLATKGGIEGISSDGTISFAVDGRPDNIQRRCEESLARLGVDHVDLYYLHRVDPRIPLEETIGAIADLVHAGKVRYVGVSEMTSEQLERAHAVHPVSAVQSEWSLWSRDIEADVVPTARRLGIGLVAYSPLGRGFLTGALSGRTLDESDARSRMPRFRDDNLAVNEAIVAEVAAVAAAHEVLPGQVALAWVQQRGEDVVPIPGTKRITYLEQNVAALDLQLTDDDLTRLDVLAQQVSGSRW